MKSTDIIRSSRARYKKFYRMVALSAAICVAVITGSLIVGDSVRKSLQLRVEDRLFGTKSVVISSHGFLGGGAIDELSVEGKVQGVLLSEGFVSRGGRFFPVMVWGVDVLPDGSPVPRGKISLNAEFAKKISPDSDPFIVLRLPDEGLVPASSLFVTSRYSTSLRLQYESTLDSSKGGNLSLRNGQVIPYNVFVNRADLCEALGIGDKLNVILSQSDIPKERISYLSPGTLGMKMEEGRITSEGIFIDEKITGKLFAYAEKPNRLFSYLVNSIEDAAGNSIPYSFATAMDSWKGERIPSDGAILSDYAASRLGLRKGDRLSVTYFVSDGLKNLSENSRPFTVSAIVPIEEFVNDGHLSADFPGLADAESCTSWDSDLPIDMSRITDEDEDYWSRYKATPKILLPYPVMREEWASSWGDATQIRTSSSEEILSSLSVEDFPVSVVSPYDEAMENAVGGVDFGGLFLALGCFIVFAALCLLYSPLGEMYALRKEEFSVLESLGFSRKGISRLLLKEVVPVGAIGAAAGSVLAILYAGAVIFLLGNIWSGATQTDGFILYPSPLTIVLGFCSGLLLSYAVILSAIRKASAIKKSSSSNTEARTMTIPLIISALMIAAIVYGVFSGASVVVFVIVGCMCLAAGIFWPMYFLSSGDPEGKSSRSFTLQSLRHSLPEVLSGMIALTLGVFITFAVGLNRKDFSNINALEGGTGGFDLWCELTVPLQHDISTSDGRNSLNLSSLGDDASVMQLTLVGGDDASCLNLNKTTAPAILGFRDEDFLDSKFTIKDNIFKVSSDEEVLKRMDQSDTVFGLVDETVLMWGLMLSVGDTLHYSGPSGEAIDVVIAGSLPNTAFQGYVLVRESSLEKHWNDRGSRLILVKSSVPEAASVLETALNEYGIRVIPANERLKTLGRVTDTYLTIFLMLGAIGLLLGIVSFLVGVRKRLASRKNDILLMRSLGYTDSVISTLLSRENKIMPVLSVLLGFISAIASVMVSFGAISLWTWGICIFVTLFSILLTILSVDRMTVQTVANTKDSDEDTDN